MAKTAGKKCPTYGVVKPLGMFNHLGHCIASINCMKCFGKLFPGEKFEVKNKLYIKSQKVNKVNRML